MKVQVYDFRWNNESECELQASHAGRFGKRIIHIGDKISAEMISSDIHCAGSVTEGVWSPCSENATGRAKCPLCKAREKSFIYTVFDGFDTSNITENDLAQIRHPHIVYLAFFDENLIKVGVSGEERKILRQLEQGALATLFIARTPDGILARQIETILKKNGFTDKIKQTQKKDFLCSELSEKEISSILQDTCKNAYNLLLEYENLKQFFLNPPEFLSWKEKCNLVAIQKSLKSFHSLELKEGEWVSGEILAIKGPFLVIETPEELVSVCTKDWLGKELDFSEKQEGLQTNEAFQSAMF